jgi:hypothetical protein
VGDGELASPHHSLSGLLNLTCIGANSSTRHVSNALKTEKKIELVQNVEDKRDA